MSPRVRKALIWTAIGLPVLFSLGWVILTLVASRQLANARASLEAAGYTMSLSDLAPPPVPDVQNAAPEFLAAFALHPDPESEDPALEKAHEGPLADLSSEEKTAVLELLGKAEPLFARIRSGRKRGACRYERDYVRGLAMDLPDIPGLIGAAKLLRLRAQAEAAAGRTSEAREAVHDIFALAESYRAEPLLVHQLVRFVAVALAVDAIHLCVAADTPEAELRAWLGLLPAPGTLDGAVERALRGELACAAQLAHGPVDEVVGPRGGLIGSGLTGLWWKASMARHLEAMRRAIEMSRGPYPEARQDLEVYVNRLKANAGFMDMISVLLFPATGRALDRQRVAQASLNVLRAGLSAEIERAAAGKYPERVDVPDPLSGRPLVYKDGAVSSAGVPGEPAEEIEKDRLTWKLRKK